VISAVILIALSVTTWLLVFAYVGGLLPVRYLTGDRSTVGLVLRAGIATLAAIGASLVALV
jgi:hypothetical protein